MGIHELKYRSIIGLDIGSIYWASLDKKAEAESRVLKDVTE